MKLEFKSFFAIIILFFFIFPQLKAQDKEHIIEIRYSREMKGYDFYISDVIDIRKDTSKLGYIFSGDFGQEAIAVLSPTTEIALQNLCEGLLKPGISKDSFVLLLHRIKIYESTNGRFQFGRCNIEIEFVRRKDGNYYSYGIFNEGSNYSIRDADITSFHAKNLIKVLKKCITSFRDTHKKDHKGHLIEENELEYSYDYSKNTKDGAYLSFGNLARNMPYGSSEFTVGLHRCKKRDSVYFIKSPNTILENNIEFFIYKGNLFKTIGEYDGRRLYLKSKTQGRYIYFDHIFSGIFKKGIFTMDYIGIDCSEYIIDTKENIKKCLDDYTMYTLGKEYPDILKAYRLSRRKSTDKEEMIRKLNDKFK